MEQRHLFPNEIDLLVDGTAGAGTAELRAHLDGCETCRARFDELQGVSDAIESVPHFVPKLRFADSVMAGVQVAEPWHAGLVRFVKRLIPTSTPVRLLAGAGASVGATLVTGAAVWVALRGDRANWLMDLLVDRSRRGLVSGASEVAQGALGADASAALAAGGVQTVAITATVLAATAILALVTFRRLAATAAAKRS